ncbi:AI-2E family transporter, partial [Micromonospora sp. NPDC048947]
MLSDLSPSAGRVFCQEVRLSRFERVRGRLRRAYQSRQASARADEGVSSDALNDTSEAARVASPAVPGPTAPASATVYGAEPPVDLHSSTSSRDDADVPHGLRIAAAWCWRLIVIGVVAWALLRIVGTVKIVIIPLAIALLLSALLAPAVGWLLRIRFPRSLATAVVLVGGLAAVIGTLTLVVNEFIRGVPELSEKSSEGVRQIQNWL